MYDVMAIGNALVDHEYLLSDAALEETDLTKGNMTLAAIEEQQQLLAYFKLAEIAPSKQAGGGSAANTMYTFASLGGKPFYACRSQGCHQIVLALLGFCLPKLTVAKNN